MLQGDKFIRNCIRDFSNEMDEFEKSTFQHFLSKNPNENAKYNELKAVWKKAKIPLPEVDSDKLERQLKARIHTYSLVNQKHKIRKPKKRRVSSKLIQSSIIFSILLFAALAVWFGGNSIQAPLISKSTDSWQRKHLTLGDGTKVWLNGSSTISFPDRFSDSERSVILDGEAFFEVMPDSLKPFLIVSNGLVTRVLGTSFNVRSYQNQKEIEVTVRTGKVSIENIASPSVRLELLPNEKGVFVKDEGVLSKTVISNPEKYFGWTTNYMVLENETLREVAKSLESRFEIEIHFLDSDLGACQLSGKLKDNSLTGVLDAISTILNLTYEVKDRTVTFSGNKCGQK